MIVYLRVLAGILNPNNPKNSGNPINIADKVLADIIILAKLKSYNAMKIAITPVLSVAIFIVYNTFLSSFSGSF